MAKLGNRELIERFFALVVAHDYEATRPWLAADVVFDWPQTRERVRGLDAMLAIDRAYPGGLPDMTPRRVVGAEDRWIVDASFTPRRISGSGDVWIGEADFRYADGSSWAYCAIVELRDGLIVHVTEYWAPRSEAPGWRAQWVEALPDA